MATTLNLKAPPNLELKGDNLAATYRDWIRSYDIFSIANEITTKSEEIQCNVFLHVAGPEAQKLYSTWQIPNADKDKIQPLKERFRVHCEGKKNLTISRYHFNTAQQDAGEKFDLYHTRLKQLASDCEFGTLQDDLIKDRIICGITEDKTRAKLLQTSDLNITKCVEMCRLTELSSRHASALASSQVHAVQKKQPPQWQRRQQQQSAGSAQPSPPPRRTAAALTGRRRTERMQKLRWFSCIY